jgi:hypothetical protein
MDINFMDKVSAFAKLLEKEHLERLTKEGYTYLGWQDNSKVTVIPGKKYIKVDVGTSGKYMVDKDENIWGIKAYGQIHHGHNYGTLDTINEWYWGDYTAHKKTKEQP